jgi:acyl-homoserine lactone acylase PvdQ
MSCNKKELCPYGNLECNLSFLASDETCKDCEVYIEGLNLYLQEKDDALNLERENVLLKTNESDDVWYMT